MEQTATLNIGLDPGYGAFKAAYVEPEAFHITELPSVVGIGETDLGLLSIGDLGSRRRAKRPDQVAFDGVVYLVGENVARYARPIQRMDFLRLSDGPELRALFYTALFHLLGEGEHRANVLIGLPVEVMADREQAQAALRSLQQWLVAEHSYRVNGTTARLAIANVQIMAQPAGTFFSWGLDNAGRWTRPKGDLKAPVAICDIGFNTIDVFTIQGGEVVARFTGGDTAGMRRAAESVIHTVRGNYGIDLSLHEADALLRQRQPQIYTSQGEVELRTVVNQALDTTAAAVVTYVERRWGNGRQFAHLLFTGGGAQALQKALLAQYPTGIVLPDPVTANALGLARYAARAFGARQDAVK